MNNQIRRRRAKEQSEVEMKKILNKTQLQLQTVFIILFKITKIKISAHRCVIIKSTQHEQSGSVTLTF